MSSQTLCRLCCDPLEHKCKNLFNASGASTEAYNIASKYFDPMLLINGRQHNLAILCSICWQHIYDFYYFQQKIYQVHLKLHQLEEINSTVKSEHDVDILHNVDGNWEEPQNKESHTPVTEAFVLENTFQFSSEDERPLKERFASKIIKVKKKVKKGEETRKSNGNFSTRNKSKTSNFLLQTEGSGDMSCNPTNSADIQMKTVENDNFIASWRCELDCDLCNAKFQNFTLLRKHFIENHADEKCYIVCCDRKFRSRYHIVEHIKLHVNPHAYRCEICGKCSTNSRNLAKHKKELHTEERKQRSLKCPKCFKVLANKNSLRVHMETHETNLIYSCRDCDKSFPSEQKRTLHERYVHNANLVCDQCGKKVHNQYSMKQHQLKHAGVEKKKWPCDLCGSELNSHSSLKRHKQLIHQKRTTVYVCSVCGKVAHTEIGLRTHKKNVHLSERNHKCSFCEKAFKSPRALREHIATHTGQDLYLCPHCDKTFKMSANMHHHRKKVHPQEWAESRLNRPQAVKIDFGSVKKEVVI